MIKILNKWLIDSNKESNTYLWNLLGSMLLAFQSVIMLMLITRIIGLYDAGIFTIAYANANLFLTIGKYGVRNYQVSDVNNTFSFTNYQNVRVLTTIVMIFVSFIYVLYMSNEGVYTIDKCLIIIVVCILKSLDSIEDVYHGYYQKNGRLDIGAKLLFLRILLTIIAFGIGLILTRNLLSALISATIVSGIFFIITNYSVKGNLIETTIKKYNIKQISLLLKICFPLFAGNFLSFYIGNAPKYAIDKGLNEELQACYGFISMPVFVIGLLNSFIFNPIIHKLSLLWKVNKKKEFYRKLIRQVLIIAGITLVCLFGAYIIGIPILSWLYNTDLLNYKAELLILIVGGGFLALSGFFVIIITIIRKQHIIIIGYSIVALLAFIFADCIVELYGLRGAAILYLVLMIILCIVFMLLIYLDKVFSKK